MAKGANRPNGHQAQNSRPQNHDGQQGGQQGGQQRAQQGGQQGGQQRAQQGGQQGGQQRRQNNQNEPAVAEAVIKGFNKDFLDKVEPFAQNLAATNSQVRNIFSMIDRLRGRGFDEEEFLMLRPRLAYAATRERSLQSLKNVLSKGVDAVVEAGDDDMKKERFERFCKCCEAIIAYARKR